MNRYLLISIILFLFTTSTNLWALGGWGDPPGGWDVLFHFDELKDKKLKTVGNSAIDGSWNHDNGSDQWDGSAPGEKGKSPGGVAINVVAGEGDPTGDAVVLSIEDTGDPRNNGFADPGSNRKVYFTYNINYNGHLLTDGVTFIARWRINPDPLEAPANGENLHDGAKGQVAVGSLNPATLFSMALDEGGILYFASEAQKALDVGDETQFKAVWATIKDSGQEINIYLNGDVKPIFSDSVVPLGNGDDSNFSNYLAIGMGSTGRDGAIQIDYIGYKVGIFEPEFYSVTPADKLSTAWGQIKR